MLSRPSRTSGSHVGVQESRERNTRKHIARSAVGGEVYIRYGDRLDEGWEEVIAEDEDEETWQLVDSSRARHSWKKIDPSMLKFEVEAMVDKIIRYPDIQHWKVVETVDPGLHQVIANALQAVLDQSPCLEDWTKEAAIKSLQSIARISDILPDEFMLSTLKRESKNAIAGGAYSDIYIGVYESRRVCMKVLRSFTSDNPQKVENWFRQEALLWRQLRHSRILPLIGISQTPSLCLVSPWMKNGNVRKFLTSNPEHDRLRMIIEIIEGIRYLHTHSPSIVHGDIRGENVLVMDDLCCCLADFGVTMAIQTRNPTSSRLGKGTAPWMSPEVWKHATSGISNIPARDIYAFGCTVIEIYSGKNPFPDISESTRIMYEVVVNRKRPPCPKELHGTLLWDIVKSCLAYTPERRPTATVVFDKLMMYASRVRGQDWRL